MEGLIITGLPQTKEGLLALDKALSEEQSTLFRSLGNRLVTKVKDTITSQDGGRWAPTSKWTRAKKARTIPLFGAEKYVKMQVLKNSLRILGKGGGWTLTQHDQGFENPPAEQKEKRDEFGRVVIPIKDAGPLNLYAEFRSQAGKQVQRRGTFAFVPKKASRTPARKIWPTEAETDATIRQPTIEWIEGLIRKIST